MLGRRRDPPARKPHPDGAMEARLQQILGLRRTIERQDALAVEYHQQLVSARTEQERAGKAYRNAMNNFDGRRYAIIMDAQQKRMAVAQAGLIAAESAISAAYEQITRLTDGLSDFDLACL